MRLNVKKGDTGEEAADWDHIDGVTDVDVKDGLLRYRRPRGQGGTYELAAIEYHHITTIGGQEADSA
jgi:hypothetical protein